MEKIERFIEKNSQLLMLGIGLLFLLWVFQAGQALLYLGGSQADQIDVSFESLQNIHDEKEKDLRLKLNMQMGDFSRHIVSAAQEKAKKGEYNSGYTPSDYFKDMKRIRMENTRIYSKVIDGYDNDQQHNLWDLLLKNRTFNKDYEKEYESAQKKYRVWLRKTHCVKSSADENDLLDSDLKKKEVDWAKVLIAILNWAITAYWRGILPIILFYFMRMEERKGILKTILADKKRFFLSVLAWPVFFWRYPFDSMREILVESELRRRGNIFRKLSKSERKKIIHVAENYSFRAWSKAFRQRNASKLQQAFLTALIVTVFMHFALPVASAQNKTKKNNSYQQQQMQEKGEHQKNDKSPPHPDSGNHDDAEFAPPYIPEEPEVNRLVLQKSVAHKKERLDKIMHVPCAGCLVKNTKQPELLSFLRHRRESWTWKRLYKKLYKKLLQSSLSATSNMRFYPTCRLKNHRWLKIYS